MEELKDIKLFTKGRMNLDVADSLLKPNEFREVYNMRFNNTEDDNKGDGEAVKGTVDIFALDINSIFNLSSGVYHKCIGFTEDKENEALIFFIYGDNGEHSILRYYINTNRVEKILFEEKTLNFQSNHRITHAFVVDGELFWTDNYFSSFIYNPGIGFINNGFNPPRSINLQKAYNFTNDVSGNDLESYFWTDLNQDNTYVQQIFDRIKYPPIEPPELLTETNVPGDFSGTIDFVNGYGSDSCYTSNNLHGRLFQFKYRYVYDDYSKSVCSPVSKVPLPSYIKDGKVYSNEIGDGNFSEDIYDFNVIGIEIKTGTREVIRIETFVREGNEGSWKLFKRINKYDADGNTISGYESDDLINVLFYNNFTGEAVDQDDINRPFDYIPQIAGCSELIEENRVVDANIIENYDNIEIDVNIDYDNVYKFFNDTSSPMEMVEFDLNSGAVFKYEFTIPTTIVSGAVYLVRLYLYYVSIPTTKDVDIIRYRAVEGDTSEVVRDNIKNQFDAITFNGYKRYKTKSDGTQKFSIVVNTVGWAHESASGFILYPSVSYSSAKSNSWHHIGLVYYDRAGRHGGVNISDNSKIFIPGNNIAGNPLAGATKRNIINFKINHQPPDWATHYQWFYDGGDISYSLQTVVRFSDIVNTLDGLGTNTGSNSYLNVNSVLSSTKQMLPNLYFGEYIWQPGDRIRLVAKRDVFSDTDTWENIRTIYDHEIKGIEYNVGDTSYEKDDSDDENFILDTEGNKIRKTTAQYLVIPKFNPEAYNIEDEDILIIELYRKRNSATEDSTRYYAVGDKIEIGDAHLPSRYHKKGTQDSEVTYFNLTDQDYATSIPATGHILGVNSYVKGRPFITDITVINNLLMPSSSLAATVNTIAPIESMWYSDFYKSEYYNKGEINLVIQDMKRQRFETKWRFGGKLLENTQINQINKYSYDDYGSVAEKYGPVNKIAEVGYTLKVEQSYKHNSIYIGKTVVKQSGEGQDIMATSKNVLGTINTSEEIYGCLNPESYIISGRRSYFVDIVNGVIIRDAPNGLEPISDYGIKDWVKERCNYLRKNCSANYILGAMSKFGEIIFTFVGIPNDLEVAGNYVVHTVVFNEDENAWEEFLDLKDGDDKPPESFAYANNVWLSFKEGEPWLHDENDLRCNFYDHQHYPEINLVVNNNYDKNKIFKSIQIDSDHKWYCPNVGDILIKPNTTYPYGMQSLLKEANFVTEEGIHKAAFKNNAMKKNGLLDLIGLITKEQLRGKVLRIKLTNQQTDENIIRNIIIKSKHSKISGV